MSEFVCQFMRVEGYGDVPNPKRKKNGHRSARQVVEELVREPHASPHVPHPQPPIIIAGDPHTTLLNARKRAEGYVDPLGRKLRRDAHIIAGCMVSYPVPVEQIQADDHEAAMLQKWITEVHEWAKKEFGESNIDCVVQHMDETSPHLHIILLRPEPGLHPSPLCRTAAAARKVAEADRKAKVKEGKKAYRNDCNLIEKAAFRAAGTQLQDSLHNSVSAYFGHLRNSPEPRPRETNPAYRKMKAQKETLRKTLDAVKQREREVIEQREALQKQQQLFTDMRLQLEMKEAAVEAQEASLAAREASVAARESSVNRVLLRPAAQLVGALLHRGAGEVRAKLGSEGARTLASVIRIARNSIGLPEISIDSAAGEVGDAHLKAMFRQVTDAQQSLNHDSAVVELRELMGEVASGDTPVPRPIPVV